MRGQLRRRTDGVISNRRLSAERAREDLAGRVEAARWRDHPGAPDSREPEVLPPVAVTAAGLDLKDIACATREAERKALLAVLKAVRWNRAAAARILKVSCKTLLNKLTECGISPSRSRPPAQVPLAKVFDPLGEGLSPVRPFGGRRA
jgi:DNA-binding NtrC family response regulator